MLKYYIAGSDRLMRLTTRAVWAVLMIPLAAAGMGYVKLKHSGEAAAAMGYYPAYVACTVLAVAAIAYFTRGMAPRGFSLNDLELKVDREIKPFSIPLQEILEARRLIDGEAGGSLRLFGASGFYGHYGLFWNRKLGKYRLYARRSKDLVLVRTAKTLFVLGPDSPEEFTEDLRRLLPR